MRPEAQEPRRVKKRVGSNVFATPPKVSVIINSFNKSAYIRETVESVIAQKFREHELIVMNDDSSDTQKLEHELQPRIEDLIYIRQRRSGEGTAWNTAIEHARGHLIAFLTAGDLWQPDFLASQYIFMQRGAYDAVYCDASIFGGASAYLRSFMQRYPSTGKPDFASLLRGSCTVMTSGTLARRQLIENAGMFENGEIGKPGLHLWLRMAREGASFGYQEKQLVKRRIFREYREPDELTAKENERAVFERISKTIEMTAEDSAWLNNRLDELDAEIALERGHSLLQSGDYTEAVNAFRTAGAYQPSLRLKAVTFLTRLAPQTAARLILPKQTPTNDALWYGR